MEELSGYLHPNYAYSLSEFGKPRHLSCCDGWILERPILNTTYVDAMGCYPLFVCRDWNKLHIDINKLTKDLVAFVLISDPFAEVDVEYLESCFDFVKPFKRHYTVDLRQSFTNFIKKHHRYYARKSFREIEVEICHEPIKYFTEWIKLYDNLIKKHNIKDIRAFSTESFQKQLNTPGMVLFVGKLKGEVVGAHLVAIHNNLAYSHLAAFSDIGYKVNAAYGIYWITLEYLTSQKFSFLDLGAAAGLEEDSNDGLSRFKKGWSNKSDIVYLCGRTFNQQKYEDICAARHIDNMDYFPAYRKGEFT